MLFMKPQSVILKYVFLTLLFVISISSAWAQKEIPLSSNDISPLLIGEKIPDTQLVSAQGNQVSMHELMKRKATVLIFYRGGWCPYCNPHLAELQEIENEIIKLGYQIIAISPDSPENLKASFEKSKLNYQLLSDADMNFAQALGLAFTVPEAAKERLSKASGGKNPGMLPVPSVFVVSQEAEILFEYINPDYKKRIKAELLLAVLKELK
jgi:peroxiredoxin